MAEVSSKSKTTTLLLAILLPPWHFIYVGKIGGFFLRVFTFNFLGIGFILDLIKILGGSFTDSEGKVISG